MFEHDYVMRLIQEMVRVILKLVFHIDTASFTAELLEDAEEKELLDTLLDMADQGKINEAENQIYELTAEANKAYLELALLFYSYLNDLPDAFLEANDFSREEVYQGLKDLSNRYGLDSIAEIFLL